MEKQCYYLYPLLDRYRVMKILLGNYINNSRWCVCVDRKNQPK